MNKKIKWLIFSILLLACLPLSGCALINVNAERDNAQVIATIDGKDIYKKDFNNNLALVQLQMESGGANWPTGSELKTLKENLYESILQMNVFALKAQDNKETIDENEAKTNAEETYEQLWESLGQDKFENILKQNYTDNDTFKSWLEDYEVLLAYSTKTTDAFEEDYKKDPSKYLDETIGKINDTDVTYGEYQYYYVHEWLNYYLSNQQELPTDEATYKETSKSIFESIEKQDANIAYAEDNDIDVTTEEINSAKEQLNSLTSYYFQEDSEFDTFLQNRFYLNKATYDKYLDEEAKGNASETAIQDKVEEDVEIPESEIQKYYNENIKKYDTTEVSAMHILTDDKEAAESIYDEAKDITNKDDFQALIDKYQDVEGVQEATDLGSFDYSKMVEEFSDAAFNADTNTVVGPVETQFGYHVIYVYDRKDGEVESLDDVKDEIETTLKQEKGQEEYDKLEEDLTGNAKYDIPDEVKTPLEQYASQLEEEYNVTRNEKNIRA